MDASTQAWVVPGAFASVKNLAADEDRALNILQAHLDWARTDHRVTGLHPWHLKDHAGYGAPYALGAFGCCLPRLDAALVKVGRQVLAAKTRRM